MQPGGSSAVSTTPPDDEGVDRRLPGPRWTTASDPIFSDPIAFVESARRDYGDLVAVTDGWSVLSRSRECPGSVTAFGPRYTRDVLTAPGVFGTQAPLADRLALPPRLRALSASVFNMSGERHRRRRRLFASLFSEEAVRRRLPAMRDACSGFLNSWAAGRLIDPVAEMRRLTAVLFDRVMLGSTADEPGAISRLTLELLEQRRRALSSTDWSQRSREREAVIATGERLDGAMRERIRHFRDPSANADDCLLAGLCALRLDDGSVLPEDEVVAQAAVFVRAGAEPVAVGLAWTLILLSQTPELRKELAARLAATPAGASCDLVAWTVRESLRLLPPNAFMARVTRLPTELGGFRLPPRCEVILSPYVSHRDPRTFHRPLEFDPSRWRTARPTPFDYLPFGLGPKHCVGGGLAESMMETALATILRRYDVSLEGDQDVEWKISVTFMPVDGIEMRVRPAADGPREGGRATGAFHRLATFVRP